MKRNRRNNGVKIEIVGAAICADNKRKTEGETKQPSKDMDVYKAVEDAKNVVTDLSIANDLLELAKAKFDNAKRQRTEALKAMHQLECEIREYKRKLAKIGEYLQKNGI